MKGGHNKGVTKYRENMVRLADELRHKEMTFSECARAAGVSKNAFLSLLNLMSFEYPVYEYGKGSKTKYGILTA